MEENRITAITKEKTDVLTEAYKDTLEILDAYDHQTLTRPEGTYYDGKDSHCYFNGRVIFLQYDGRWGTECNHCYQLYRRG